MMQNRDASHQVLYFFSVLVNVQRLKEVAIRKYDIYLCQSYFIGDAPIDLDFAINRTVIPCCY